MFLKRTCLIKLSVIAAFLVIANGGCKNESHHNVVNVQYDSFAVQTSEFKEIFKSGGEIRKVVKLDSREDSILGTIDRVITDSDGDFYVGDYNSSKKIYRFDRNGTFVNSIGRIGQGPGEYDRITSFALTSDNSLIIMSSSKLLKYDKSGKLLKERRIDFLSRDMVSFKDHIYIAVNIFLTERGKKSAVLVFDLELEEQDGLFEYDNRLEKYSYLPVNHLAENKGALVFSDHYDLRLRLYNPLEKPIVQLQLPNENFKLNTLWEKKNFVENDLTEIKKNLHRFNMVLGSGDYLFLVEDCRSKNVYNYWVIDLTKKKALVFKYTDPAFFENNLFFSVIVGSYEKGIIGVFNDPEKFNKHKKDYRVLQDIEFTNEDNPLLFFFEFNPI